jgi:adenine-specific DNA methylase
LALLEENIKRVNTKLQQLLKQYAYVQKENARLQKDLDEAKAQHTMDLEHIEQLKMQISILKTSTGQMNEAEKKSFDKQISQYIKEIDKCIGLLSE